jgi:hypothetical protein
MNSLLASIDLEHQMAEKWLLWPRWEHRLLWLDLNFSDSGRHQLLWPEIEHRQLWLASAAMART